MIDLLEVADFIDAATRERIAAELRMIEGKAATVYGGKGANAGVVESNVRKAMRLPVSEEIRADVMQRLRERKEIFAEHFRVALNDCEEPQFLRYRTGDFFVAHQDGNTPLIYDDSRFRKISVVIFLSLPSTEPLPGTYGGGQLIFHGRPANPPIQRSLAGASGSLVAFRAETTHEVLPVTHGERYTIACWFR